MPRFVARVTRFRAIRTIPKQMPGLITLITSLSAHPLHPPRLGTGAGDVPRFIAIVTGRRVRTLLTVFCEMSLSVAPITSLRILLAVPGEVPQTVALVALLAGARERVAAAAVATPATSSGLRTLAGVVARSAALVTDA